MPFELVDAVLEETRSVQRRLRDLPSRADMRSGRWGRIVWTACGRSRGRCRRRRGCVRKGVGWRTEADPSEWTP
ncbi:hypothetical protein [Streptomyces antimycoticus]|uniref:hypothetical protein n=1 Tax=Streptomyces antimycoticus TaxID=68175 RepID=UPI0030B82FB5